MSWSIWDTVTKFHKQNVFSTRDIFFKILLAEKSNVKLSVDLVSSGHLLAGSQTVDGAIPLCLIW